jgi:hypothetical protein
MRPHLGWVCREVQIYGRQQLSCLSPDLLTLRERRLCFPIRVFEQTSDRAFQHLDPRLRAIHKGPVLSQHGTRPPALPQLPRLFS